MLRLLKRLLSASFRRRPLLPRVFDSQNYECIDTDRKIEEERFPGYRATDYYPVRIGEVFAERYQVVGKLGYGTISTVWLARDLKRHNHVALKIFIQTKVFGSGARQELDTYQHIAAVAAKSRHPGRRCVRKLLDHFVVQGPDSEHTCLVHPPLWNSMSGLLHNTRTGLCPPNFLRTVFNNLLLGLSFLHNECQVIHTDIKADNIMIEIDQPELFEEFEKKALEKPIPRKEVDGGRYIYVSRQFSVPKELGAPILCDFSSAIPGKKLYHAVGQPEQYRSPEVLLGVPWSYEIDIWNLGCLLWGLLEGSDLFPGYDAEREKYTNRAHIASIISLLGMPPKDLLERSKGKDEFLLEDGAFSPKILELPSTPRTFEDLKTNHTDVDEKERAQFLEFLRRMLQWRPEDRSLPKELLKDPWMKA